MLKFKPLILVIIENIMHLRKETGKKKEINDIMLSLPLGLKYLIEYMPFIFEFIQESFHNKDENTAIDTFTHWIRVISNLSDITDPIIGPTFPEFSFDLFETFYINYINKTKHYGTIFWLISKLGSKCRLYNYNENAIKNKTNSGDGCKIIFYSDKFGSRGAKTNNIYSIGVDHILCNLFSTIFENPSKYAEYLKITMEFLSPCILFFVNPQSMDVGLVKKCIKNVLLEKSNENIFNDANAKRIKHSEDSKIHRSKQIRAFELTLRMIFAACSIESKSVGHCFKDAKDFQNMFDEIKLRIKQLARHFTMLYICKNGRLFHRTNDNLDDKELEYLQDQGEINVGCSSFLKITSCEINPLIFIDII
jgi:hypothetical protein